MNERRLSQALLIMRVILGVSLLSLAFPKLIEGPATWAEIGLGLSIVTFGLSIKLLGLLFLCVMVLGAFSFFTGYFFSVFSLANAIVFALYSLKYFRGSYSTLAIYAAGLAGVFLGLMLIGAGKYVISLKLEKK